MFEHPTCKTFQNWMNYVNYVKCNYVKCEEHGPYTLSLQKINTSEPENT